MPARKPKVGRPPVESRRESISVRFHPDQLTRLDALAEKKGTTRTALIQIAVAEMLDKK